LFDLLATQRATQYYTTGAHRSTPITVETLGSAAEGRDLLKRGVLMTEDTKSPAVTRGELYPILGSVNLLIALAWLGLVRSSEQNTLLLIGHFMLFAVAVVLSITYSVFGIRGRLRRMSARSNPAEPVDGLGSQGTFLPR